MKVNIIKPSQVKITDATGNLINPAKEDGNLATIKTNTNKLVGLGISEYDYVSYAYTGSNLTGAVFKTGGAAGTTVATLTLTYDTSDNLLTIVRV